jgi:L-threonylcarbamoyladenylate synthase
VTAAEVDAAAGVLRRGGLVAFPTETVYGLGADATDPVAVRRVFAVKGRPLGHPLIAHLPDAEAALGWGADLSDGVLRLAAALWPGPLTVVVRRRPGLADEVTGGRDTVGLRVPDHPVARALLDAVGRPLAAPSANRFGRVSPTCAADVHRDLGADVDLVLDGGPCAVGVESTIVELVGDGPAALLRPGGVPAEVIAEVLGRELVAATGPARAPGMLASHYAPSVPVELVAADHLDEVLARRRAGPDAAPVGVLAPWRHPGGPGVVVLEPPRDVRDYARRLYRSLRDADEAGVGRLLVVPPPPEGLGLAVLDRLRKAAAPRSDGEPPRGDTT